MFVRLVKKSNNHVSIRIVENVRESGKVKQKIICGVGHFHKNNLKEIEERKKIANELIIKIKNESSPSLPGFEKIVHEPKTRKDNKQKNSLELSKRLKEESRISIGIDDIFEDIYHQLGLSDAIDTGYKKEKSNQLLKRMVLSRIEKPCSKRKSVETIKRDKLEIIDLSSVYRMMDKVYDNRRRIQDKIVNNILNELNQKIDVAFFDVTTLYFESFIPDELRICGYSKDNKFKETQVMLALMTTIEGLPLGYELFPGNTYEGNTLINAIFSLKRRYDISNTFIVADRAMFTRSNLELLDKYNINFIISAKLKNTKKGFRDNILRDIEKTKKNNKNILNITKEYKYLGRRIVVSYNKKRADKSKHDRERLIRRIRSKMDKAKVKVSDLINNTGTKKYLKFEKRNREEAYLNIKKIEEEKRWDGIYAVASNYKKKDISGNKLLEKYRGLWQIEDAFRINKHDLKMRPIYHWTPKRIKSHVLICFICYTLMSLAKYKLNKKKLKLSIETIRKELSYMQASIVRDNITGKKFILPSRPTDLQNAIYNALGLKIKSPISIIN